MKLVMFTPVDKKSAIGRMASLVTRALIQQGDEVTIVRTEEPAGFSPRIHDFSGPILPWNADRRVEDLVRDADVSVYHVGDSYQFHCGCLEWLTRAPGIVCLHDYYVGSLFFDWSRRHQADAVAVVRALYGEEAADRFFVYQ